MGMLLDICVKGRGRDKRKRKRRKGTGRHQSQSKPRNNTIKDDVINEIKKEIEEQRKAGSFSSDPPEELHLGHIVDSIKYIKENIIAKKVYHKENRSIIKLLATHNPAEHAKKLIAHDNKLKEYNKKLSILNSIDEYSFLPRKKFD